MPRHPQVQMFVDSPAFRAIHRALLFRREQLLALPLTDPYAIAHNRGAVEEIQRWLQHPEVVIADAELRVAEEKAQRDAGNPVMDEYEPILRTAHDLESTH